MLGQPLLLLMKEHGVEYFTYDHPTDGEWCMLKHWAIPEDLWNNRPIEDALTAELAEANKRVEELEILTQDVVNVMDF